MQLLSLDIQNFRVIRHARLDFPDAVLGIVGQNGSGKSTLVEAITWVLYGNQVARSGKDDIKSVFASETETCQASLTFKIHDHIYRMTRRLVGRTQRSEVELLRDELPQSIGSTETKDEITKLLGLDWRGFLTSFLARQQELNALSELQPSKRRDHLAGMLGIERIDRALQSIKTDIKIAENSGSYLEHLLIENNSLPAQIATLREQIQNLQTALATLSGARTASQSKLESVSSVLREHETKKQACSQLLSRIAIEQKTDSLLTEQAANTRKTLANLSNFESEIQRITPKLSQYDILSREHAALTESKIRADQHQNLLHQLADLTNESASLEAKLASITDQQTAIGQRLAALPTDLDPRLESINRDLEKIREQFSQHQAQIDAATKEIAKLERSQSEINRIGPDAVCDRCHRPFGDDLAKIRQHLNAELTETKASRGQLQASLEEITKQGKALKEQSANLESQTKLRFELDLKQSALTKEKADLAERQKRTSELQSRLTAQLSEIGELPFDTARFDLVTKTLGELNSLKERYNQLLGKIASRNSTESELAQIETRLAAVRESIAHLKIELSQIGYSETEHATATQVAATAQTQYLEDQDRFAKTGHELELTMKELSHKEELNQKLETSRQELERHRNDRFYGQTLARLFSEFRHSLIARIRPRLAELSSQLMSDMTDGRYGMIELDEEYNIRMFDDGNFFGIDRFSGGEKDLANLCLRLAISQALTESAGLSRSFVILDEVFASQDDGRRELIVRGLIKLKNHFPQILLITHIPEIKDMVEKVINVERTTQGWSEVSTNGK